MVQTIARIKQAGKNFEIIVDLENALKFKKGESSSVEAEGDRIFTDSKKGMTASNAELTKAFGTAETEEIIKKIIKSGEILLTQEYREEEKEKKLNQIIDFLAKNTADPKTGNPHSPERIKNALKQVHINIKNVPMENQINEIVAELSKVLPIKIERKKIRIKIPAVYTGKAYGVISQYKEEEKWLNDGSLEVIVNIPSGIIMDFYNKLNSVTHGSSITEELKEKWPNKK